MRYEEHDAEYDEKHDEEHDEEHYEEHCEEHYEDRCHDRGLWHGSSSTSTFSANRCLRSCLTDEAPEEEELPKLAYLYRWSIILCVCFHYFFDKKYLD